MAVEFVYSRGNIRNFHFFLEWTLRRKPLCCLSCSAVFYVASQVSTRGFSGVSRLHLDPEQIDKLPDLTKRGLDLPDLTKRGDLDESES